MCASGKIGVRAMAEIRVKVTDEEHKIVEQNAEMLDMEFSTYVRQVTQNPNIIHFDYSAIEKHTQQVGKIVNSVNQLIFTIEMNNDFQPKEIDYIVECAEQIMKTERQLLRTVRKQWEKAMKQGRSFKNDSKRSG
jgi:hypothetical protein